VTGNPPNLLADFLRCIFFVTGFFEFAPDFDVLFVSAVFDFGEGGNFFPQSVDGLRLLSHMRISMQCLGPSPSVDTAVSLRDTWLRVDNVSTAQVLSPKCCNDGVPATPSTSDHNAAYRRDAFPEPC